MHLYLSQEKIALDVQQAVGLREVVHGAMQRLNGLNLFVCQWGGQLSSTGRLKGIEGTVNELMPMYVCASKLAT